MKTKDILEALPVRGTFGGNCGMFAIALADLFVEAGEGEVAVCMIVDEDKVPGEKDLQFGDYDLTHVIVQVGEKHYDGDGEVNLQRMADWIHDEYEISGALIKWCFEWPEERKVAERIIRNNTAWNTLPEEFEAKLKERHIVSESSQRVSANDMLLAMYARKPSDFDIDDYFDKDYNPTKNEILEAYEDFLRDERQIEIDEENGVALFEDLSEDQSKIIGDLPVGLFHYTSSKLEKRIKEDGLRSDTGKDVNRNKYENLGVYLTTETHSNPVRGYIGRAKMVFGGDGLRVFVKTYLKDLSPDDNDADIRSGRTQFVVKKIAPDQIIATERWDV